MAVRVILFLYIGHVAVSLRVFFLMIRRPPRSTLDRSSAASDVYKRQRLYDAIENYLETNKIGGETLLSPLDVIFEEHINSCLLYTSPSPRDRTRYRMPSSA